MFALELKENIVGRYERYIRVRIGDRGISQLSEMVAEILEDATDIERSTEQWWARWSGQTQWAL